MRRAISLIAGGLLLVTSSSVLAAYISPALLVDQPGLVLMVDGKDSNSEVSFKVKVRANSAGYDFGFMAGDSFSSLLGACCKAGAVFAGGVLVDFAVRSQENQVFRLSDMAAYADQYYFGRIQPANSRNPEVLDPYYSTLLLIWDLDHDGITDLRVTLNSRHALDGFQPVPTAPVPLPAAAWLFGSGLAGLVALARRRRMRV